MLYLATDHRGLKLKNQLKAWLGSKKISYKDLGTYNFDQNDSYVHISQTLCTKVLENPEEKGIIFCGSGAGVSIACNKIKGIRCGLGFNHHQVKSFVEHDNVNVLALPADYLSKFKCFQLVKSFLNANFNSESRHQERLEQLSQLEK